MPRTAVADRLRISAKFAAIAVVAAAGLSISGPAATPLFAALQQPAQADPDGPDGAGKDHNEFVFVRDSAIATEKLALAEKMERLKEWPKSADLYQEVLEKYRDRVVSVGPDAKGMNTRYESVSWKVLQRLSKWPQDGLDVYRGRYEPKAAELVSSAKGDNLAPLYEAFRKYFVTEAAKQAGIRLIDASLERGEYAAAAEIGDQLLTMYPKDSLIAERPSVLFRTALAYLLSGSPDAKAKADERARVLNADFPKVMGVVRGKDAVLADALTEEFKALTGGDQGLPATATTDAWPTFGGGPSRGVVSSAKANPGTRLYSLALAKPNFNAPNGATRLQMQQAFDEASKQGFNNGIMPVVDRGELFFQDGTRVYASMLESGVPLSGWLQNHPESAGQYVMKDVVGSTRACQQTLTLTDRHVLAVMGQQDRQSLMMFGMQPSSEPRLVCLDRMTGKELWRTQLSSAADVPKNDDEKAVRALMMSGAPLVVGDTVLTMGRSARGTQGEDCYVLSFDLNTGKFRWACFIASAGMPANAMYGMPQPMNDNTSHLAYANGRVFCLTNVGAVAALDAYSGTIVWLDIYPLDPPAMVARGWGNPAFMNGSQGGKGRIKPWQYNPAVVVDGKVFVLPTEGKSLIIYDATSGKELKQIDLETVGSWLAKRPGGNGQPERPSTLVGVMGTKIILAGDSNASSGGEGRLIMFDWQKYNEDFPGKDYDQVYWPSLYPKSLAGRPFLTTTSVYTADDSRIRRVDLKTGNAIDNAVYPPGNRPWDDGEGPGNIIVSGDHVIVAGASSVDVYTDLGLATAKLDKEVTDSPRDVEPRLRYAEVMFAAGQGETALTRLNEAIKLMGGMEKLEAGPNRDRLFNDALTFAVKGVDDKRPATQARVNHFFDISAAAANTAQQQVTYRVSRARFAEQQVKDPATAVRLYQEILATAETRAVTVLDEQGNAPAQAEDLAEKAISALVRSAGPAIYEKYEQAAQKALAKASDQSDAVTKAGELLAVAQTYPNATVAAPATMSAAESFESAGKPREAIRVLRQMWFKYQSGPGRTQILEAIARNYLAVPDRNRAQMAGTATARLMMAAGMPGDPKVTKDLKLPDGTVITKAGEPLTKALDEVRRISSTEAGKALPNFHIPPWAKGVKPFIPMDRNAVLPDSTSLVLPARDFSRPDRVMTWSSNGLSIFAVGAGLPQTPQARSIAFAANNGGGSPRGVSWSGDTALVWGGSRCVAVDSASGKVLWTIDLASMGQLEIVRGGDAPGVPSGNDVALGGGQVIINGRMNGVMMVRNGVVIRGGAIPQQIIQQPVNLLLNPNPSQPPPPDAVGGEQVSDVRPVGDRVLVVSNTGRVVSADLAGGRVKWQARLAEQAPDRLVASEDFTVVRVSDDLTVRMFALDTDSGRVIGNKAYNRQSASFPVNMALSPEGTLVYTLPDRLCLKDLYKPWDEEEKVVMSGVPGGPAQPIYAGASQPGQLVITEGRILALADSLSSLSGMQSNEKYVRVHSLETGAPLSLRYTSGDTKREVDQILTSGTKDWNVMIRTVGPKVYVIGPKNLYAYNLDKPAETWRGSTDIFETDNTNDDANFRDAFIGTRHLVILDQPTPRGGAAAAAAAQPGAPAAPGAPGAAGPATAGQYRLHVFARYPSQSAPQRGESGKLDHSFAVIDPAGVAPQWQACDGGFFYATQDGKVRALMGAEK